MGSLNVAADTGFHNAEQLVLPIKAPYDTKYTEVRWNTDKAETAGVPLTAEGCVFLPVGNKIQKLNETTGEHIATVELSEKVSEEYRGIVIGNTLVQPTRTGVSVVNLNTMALVNHRDMGAEIITDIALSDDCLYFAYSDGEGSKAVSLTLSGGLETLWEYSLKGRATSPTTDGEWVIFGAEDSLVCYNKKSGAVVENYIGASVTSAPFAGEYAVYLSAEDGCVYKLRLTEEGTIEDDTLTPCKVGAGLSAPLAYNGRVYVSSDEGFFILDSLNMKVLHSYPDLGGGTSPLVCIGNGPRVYVTAPLEDYWCLYSIYDTDELEQPQLSQLAKLEDFTGGTVSAAMSGTLYFRDAFGRMFALALVEYSILMIIIKLILMLGIVVLAILLIRQLVKQRSSNNGFLK